MTLIRDGWFGFVLIGISIVYAGIDYVGFSTGGFLVLTVVALTKKRDRILNTALFLSGASLIVFLCPSPITPDGSDYLLSIFLIAVFLLIVFLRSRSLTRRDQCRTAQFVNLGE